MAITSTQDNRELRLEQYIGMTLRKQRKALGLKISDVSALANISQGMLSKIENAQVSTSLEILKKLCDALGLTLSQLFHDFDLPEGGAQLVRNGEGLEVVRRGTERGHTYHLLAYNHGQQKTIEPYVCTLDDAAEVFPMFSHPGVEFMHVLEGEIDYRHGNNVYQLKPGDSLTFEGEVPHGPEILRKVPIRLLCVISFQED